MIKTKHEDTSIIMREDSKFRSTQKKSLSTTFRSKHK